MNIKELLQIKEEDIIYNESERIGYNVIKVYKSGILAYWEWTNPYGRFTENKFLKNEELLCNDMILI
jgi:hypothetical protein